MNRKERKPVAESIVQMQRELEEYRRSRPRRAKLPESIWEAATALARQHGLYAVTQALRLDDTEVPPPISSSFHRKVLRQRGLRVFCLVLYTHVNTRICIYT